MFVFDIEIENSSADAILPKYKLIVDVAQLVEHYFALNKGLTFSSMHLLCYLSFLFLSNCTCKCKRT
jgi:hypothetical protein